MSGKKDGNYRQPGTTLTIQRAIESDRRTLRIEILCWLGLNLIVAFLTSLALKAFFGPPHYALVFIATNVISALAVRKQLNYWWCCRQQLKQGEPLTDEQKKALKLPTEAKPVPRDPDD